VTDVEGVERIDFANNMTSQIHGHAHPLITEAVSRQLSRGTAFSFGTEIEIEYAEQLVERSRGFERIRFVNSGTEAVMACLKAARAFTGRAKIAKVEGAYHGLYDYAEISQTANPSNWGSSDRPSVNPVAYGTPQGVLDDVVILPFNEPDTALDLLDDYRDSIACVLVDPMPHRAGVIPATPAFIAALRSWTAANGALLVFDEVITFRSAFGGAQDWFDAVPDLTALGKMIGGGFPIGAIAGRADVLEVMNPLAPKLLFPHSGTFSANPVSMAAGLTAMTFFDRASVDGLNELADYARTQLTDAIAAARVEACIAGGGSMLKLHFRASAPRTYREAYESAPRLRAIEVFLNLLLEDGIILINSGAMAFSTPMRRETIDRLTEAVLKALRTMRPDIERLTASGD
jgi:glutamate-1-semialdehyde 2,1-aminomutase